jgi:hypothetical protein
MGGPGSGSHYHWWRSSTKAVVEECLRLDANSMTRQGALRPGLWRPDGTWRWSRGTGREEQTVSIGYEVGTTDPAWPWLRLFYTFLPTRERIDYRVSLQTTRPRFGGLRWWFTCPLTLNGAGCGRRVGKLYLPPGARYFGCRVCHKLTYRSAQEHDKRVDALRRNPEALLALMENAKALSPTQLLLALKADRYGQD